MVPPNSTRWSTARSTPGTYNGFRRYDAVCVRCPRPGRNRIDVRPFAHRQIVRDRHVPASSSGGSQPWRVGHEGCCRRSKRGALCGRHIRLSSSARRRSRSRPPGQGWRLVWGLARIGVAPCTAASRRGGKQASNLAAHPPREAAERDPSEGWGRQEWPSVRLGIGRFAGGARENRARRAGHLDHQRLAAAVERLARRRPDPLSLTQYSSTSRRSTPRKRTPTPRASAASSWNGLEGSTLSRSGGTSVIASRAPAGRVGRAISRRAP